MAPHLAKQNIEIDVELARKPGRTQRETLRNPVLHTIMTDLGSSRNVEGSKNTLKKQDLLLRFQGLILAPSAK
jgi:hypothetical protein